VPSLRDALAVRLVPALATHGVRLLRPALPDALVRVDTGAAPVAYLTFDDGPTPTITTPLLDLLDRYDAQATHFLLGAHASAYPSLVARMTEAGHTVANHTYTHPSAWRTPAATVDAELSRTTDVLERLTGRPVRHLRPPYGHLTNGIRRWARQHGQRVVLWDSMPGDFLRATTAARVARLVRRHLRPGSVVVLHDNPICDGVTLPALRRLLPELADTGWRFEAL
jgi:peptidoglycan/xylan/chitin deacetylase (PgdA/CDA1 family)